MAVRKSPLRAVSPDEKPPVSKPKSVTEAAKGGTTRELLAATRDRIAVAVEDPNTPARDLAALSKRLMETVREIEAIDARTEEAESHAEVEDGKFDSAAV
jgi:hypothetical protein